MELADDVAARETDALCVSRGEPEADLVAFPLLETLALLLVERDMEDDGFPDELACGDLVVDGDVDVDDEKEPSMAPAASALTLAREVALV